MQEMQLRNILDACERGDYTSALALLDGEIQGHGPSGEVAAFLARVAAVAGDRERLNRATLWLTQQKGRVSPEFAAEGFYWRGDLVSALRTLEAVPEPRREEPGWHYLWALIHYRQGRVHSAYRALTRFAQIRKEAADETEILEEGLDLLAEGSLTEDQLEDWRMILGDCETEVAEGKPMGLRLSRLSEEIEKAVWGGRSDRSGSSFDRALARLAAQLELEKPLEPAQAEQVLLPFIQLIKLAVVEEELQQSWERRDWGEIADRFLDFFTGRLREQRDRLELGNVEVEKQDLLSLSKMVPLAVLRPLVYLTTLARFPDHEVIDRILAERAEEVLVLVAMSVLLLATQLDIRPGETKGVSAK